MYFNFLSVLCISLAISGGDKKIIYGKNDTAAHRICKVAGKSVYRAKHSNAFFYKAGMAIDADGSPRAYHHNDGKALDYRSNGGVPGDWWAIVTVNGQPYIQGENDPYPGFYISMTSLEDTEKELTDPNRYVNAEEIPYIVLPEQVKQEGGAELGDFAVVINRNNGKLAYAIFADGGPPNKLGEGSIALAKLLGINANPKNGGTPNNITYLVFPGSGNSKKRSLEEINKEGELLLTVWGGQELLSSFYK